MPSITIHVGQKADLGRGRVALSPMQVDAEVFGRWAVHLTWDVAGGIDFTVTHVPSGLALADRMDRNHAVDLARALTLSLDIEHIDRDRHGAIAEREVKAAGGRFLRSSDLGARRGGR